MKNSIRKNIIEKRQKLDKNEVLSMSDTIMDKVILYLKENNFHNILIYLDFNNEVSTKKIIDCDEFNLFITKTLPQSRLEINKYDKTRLIKHKFGYYESNDDNYIDPTIIDAIIIPGVAFDFEKNRVGYGAGYYDRFLVKAPQAKKIAVCFEMQLVDKIPVDKYDKKMDLIISEKRVIK